VGYTLLLEGDAPSICKGSAMKEKIIKKLVIISIIKNTHLEGCTRQSCSVVRRGSHQSGSPQNGLRDEQTCGMTLASAYVLYHLSAAWSQLQMMGTSLRWK